MGKEIRMVPEGWKHPTIEEWRATGPAPTTGCPYCQAPHNPADPGAVNSKAYHPLLQEDYATAALRYRQNVWLWCQKLHEDNAEEGADFHEAYPPTPEGYGLWAGPAPDPHWHADYKGQRRLHIALYENTTEGTPISPTHPTLEALLQDRFQHPDDHSRYQGMYQAMLVDAMQEALGQLPWQRSRKHRVRRGP